MQTSHNRRDFAHEIDNRFPDTVGKVLAHPRRYFRNTFLSVGELNLTPTNKSRESLSRRPLCLTWKFARHVFLFICIQRWQYKQPNKCTKLQQVLKCREFHSKERTRLLDVKLQPELRISCNVSRRLQWEDLVNSAVKTDNFSLKTVELSWHEHRENVTPATRASSIARSQGFWVTDVTGNGEIAGSENPFREDFRSERKARQKIDPIKQFLDSI